MGNGSIDAGNKRPARNSDRRTVDRSAGPDGSPELQIDGLGPQKPDARICGAMSQQHGDRGGGIVSAPQKFVHLVGYRDPNARTGQWVRPRPVPPKRQA